MLFARITQAAELDLDSTPPHRLRTFARGVDVNGIHGQTLDGTARFADEMGVTVFLVFAFSGREFETPDVVAVVGAMQEPGFGHVHQVAVERGPIETRFVERVGDLAMGHRPFESLQHFEHRDTRTRYPEPTPPE